MGSLDSDWNLFRRRLYYCNFKKINMKSEKFSLIWEDIKSAFVSFLLIAGPIIILELITLLTNMEQNIFTELGTIALGFILKIVQKYNQTNTY